MNKKRNLRVYPVTSMGRFREQAFFGGEAGDPTAVGYTTFWNSRSCSGSVNLSCLKMMPRSGPEEICNSSLKSKKQLRPCNVSPVRGDELVAELTRKSKREAPSHLVHPGALFGSSSSSGGWTTGAFADGFSDRGLSPPYQWRPHV